MIAFDTNVLIYACDQGDPERQRKAIELIARTTDGVTLWQVACEFIAASRKIANDHFTTHQAWARLDEFLALFPLAVPSRAALAHARTLHAQQNWSFWDATIVAACVDCGVNRLYSEDLPGGSPPEGLELINPFA